MMKSMFAIFAFIQKYGFSVRPTGCYQMALKRMAVAALIVIVVGLPYQFDPFGQFGPLGQFGPPGQSAHPGRAGFVSNSAHAQSRKPMRFIRDAETESIIRSLSKPLFAAASLDPSSVRILLVEDNKLNAFVAGGQNIFIHTGLIVESKTPEALLGVIAHETGHIQGGHLVRSRDAIEQARTIGTISAILGAAAAIGSKRGDVGSAIMLGGQEVSNRSFLQFSRTQESAADQAALRLLGSLGLSAKGLGDFLGTLEDQELVSPRFQDPYLRTHPLSRERIEIIRNHVTSSPYSGSKLPEAVQQDYQRMVAKLHGFLEPFNQVMRRYPESDSSVPARYARAIAYYRKSDIKPALVAINGLIEDFPRNAYFHEMKGQMLFEFSRAVEALPAYARAYELAPDQALLALELARVELELGDPSLLQSSIEHFSASLALDSDSAFAWRQLGIAYGRNGQMAMSSLALSEEALRQRRFSDAERLAKRAMDGLENGSRAYIRAEDVMETAKNKIRRKK